MRRFLFYCLGLILLSLVFACPAPLTIDDDDTSLDDDGTQTPTSAPTPTPVPTPTSTPVPTPTSTPLPTPTPFLNTIGQPCDLPANCFGSEVCFDEATFGPPQGVCTQTCQQGTCPGNTVCTTGPSGTWCAPPCTQLSDCRAGYTCLHYLAQPACWPDCASGADCPQTATCNDSIGLCNQPPGGLPDGEACTNHSSCASGICLDSALGFPGGYCAGLCSRSRASCPAGSTCATLAPGDDGGLCLKDCTAANECRFMEGYTCAALPTTGGQQVCEPGFR